MTTHSIRYALRVVKLKDHDRYIASCTEVPLFKAHARDLGELRVRIERGMKRALEADGLRIASVSLDPEAPEIPAHAYVSPVAAIAHLAPA